MINLRRDIHSLTDFKRHTNDLVKRMKVTRTPIVLTVNGKAELVVQDEESYQALLDRLEQMERGEGRPAEKVFAEFRSRHGIPNA
jgi:prevent-host-death family protein